MEFRIDQAIIGETDKTWLYLACLGNAKFLISTNAPFVKLQCNLTQDFDGCPLNESRPMNFVTAKSEISNFGDGFIG